MTNLDTYIDSFKNIKVLVIGDIMLDRFVYGSVDRISPEAPVPVFKYQYEKQMLGGAGNVIANLTALGCSTTFVGITGKDEHGKKLKYLLDQTGAKSYLLTLSNYPTIVKTRLIAGNNHLLRSDQEEILPILESKLPRFQKLLNQIIKKHDIVILSDYNKGLLTTATAPMFINTCKKMHKTVIVDPKGKNYSKYRGADLIKPNLKEFAESTNAAYDALSSTFHQEIQKNAQKLLTQYQIKNLLITLSEHGMLHISAETPKKLLHIPTVAKEVFDVSGAGDTSIATLGACLGVNLPIKEAMELANLASGIVVGKLGTATVTAKELKDALRQRETSENIWKQKNKIITLEQAAQIIQDLKGKGKTIGMTNGCFDCCHLGHLHSFIQTKKHCDILVVAMNSDMSVKRNKGQERPLQDEKTRSLLLASLEFIDYVIIFDENTPLHIVKAIKPDVIAKEGYSLDQWPEGRYVKEYGGQAIILPRIEGYSTSSLISKIRR